MTLCWQLMRCRATTRELPGYFPFHVVQDLISYSTDQWKSPALTLIDEINQIVVDHQSSLVKSHFAKGTPGLLYQTVACVPLSLVNRDPG